MHHYFQKKIGDNSLLGYFKTYKYIYLFKIYNDL